MAFTDTLTSILFSGESKAEIGHIQLDASLSEQHRRTAKATAFPVEDGATVSDHVFVEPEGLVLEGFVTDSPVRFASGIRSIIEGDAGGSPIGQALGLGTGETRSQAAYKALEEILDAADTITVKTGLKVYDDMVMVRLEAPRDSSLGHAIRFSAEFVKIRKVTSLAVDIPKSILKAGKEAKKAASKVDQGRVAPKSPPRQSVFSQGVEGLAKLFTR